MSTLEDLLRMLPVKGSAAAIDFLDQRNEDRAYIERYVPAANERQRYHGDAVSINPITGEPEE